MNTANAINASFRPQPTGVKCPMCVKEGKKSKVYPSGGSTTCAYYQPFYDEDGNYHCHDANVTTTQYTCSEGHAWQDQSSGSCWCGWPEKPYKMFK